MGLAEQLAYEPDLEVRLDLWNLTPGASLTRYMEEIASAAHCILVCTPNYAAKANGRAAGVGYEAQIITADILNGVAREKFIPIIRIGDFKNALPTAFQGSLALDFRIDDQFPIALQTLLRAIRGQPEYVPPPKGRATPLPARPNALQILGGGHVITARIQNWYELNIPVFTRDVFDWYDALPSDNSPLTLEILAPQLDALAALVRAQSARGTEQQIVLEQRRAVSYAVHRMRDIKLVGAQLLKSGPEKFGPADIINNTINCIDMFLRLCLAELTHHLGNYQLGSEPSIFTGFDWFKIERLSEISQFVYQQPVLLEVYVRHRDSEHSSAEVYLPLGILPDDNKLLIEGDRIFSSSWARIVVPQMAARKMTWPESLLELDHRCCFLSTHGKKWHGSQRYESDESWEQTEVEPD